MSQTEGVREQRKVVTALFVDVVGSTTLGEELDPEDLMDIVGGAMARMVECVERFGGTVKDLAGDGVLALFGAPASHEDDAERAVRAGFDIMEVMAVYSRELRERHRGPLSVRAGIETGRVAVGLVGGGRRVELAAMGDAVNTAARLQAAAAPGTILLGEGTFRHVGDVFEFEGPLELSLKGKADLVTAYRPIRLRPPMAAAPQRPGADVAIAGRDSELNTLRKVASRLIDREGGVILVTGEPGIGKSRMLAELRHELSTLPRLDGATEIPWLEGRCRSFAATTPYGPFREMLSRWLDRVAGSGSAYERRRVVEVTIGGDGAGVIADLEPVVALPLTPAEVERARRRSPEEHQLRTREAMAALVHGLAATPVAVVIEDLQWADSSSLALLERLLRCSSDLPVLFVLSARTEADSLAALREAAAREFPRTFVDLRLAPLGPTALRALLSALLGSSHLPDAARSQMLDASGGNPFYLEELTRAMMEEGTDFALTHGGRGNTTLQVPSTIEQVLMARFDALSSQAHDALEASSVIGSPFTIAMLKAVVGDGRIYEAVRELERADLVRPDPDRSDEYRFKHALMQETAYGSLLKRRRRELHAATARAIEAAAGDGLDETADIIARHLMEAGDLAGAYRYGRIAGQRWRALFANEEAIAAYRLARNAAERLRYEAGASETGVPDDVAGVTEALGQVLTLVGSHDAAREQLALALAETAADRRVARARLQRRIGDTLQAQYRNEEALAHYASAGAVLEEVPLSQRDDQWWDEWLNVGLERVAAHYWLGEGKEMAELEAQLRPVVELRASHEQRIRHATLAKDLRLRQTRYRIDDQTLKLAHIHVAAATALGDPRQLALAQFELAFCELFRWDLDRAAKDLKQSLAGVERVGDAVARVRVLAYLSLLFRLQQRADAVVEQLDRLVDASLEASLYIYIPLERANRAWFEWRSGDAAAAQALAQDAVNGWAQSGIAFPFQWAARWVALAVTLDAGDVASAATHGLAMLAPDQQLLPGPIVRHLEAAGNACAGGNDLEAERHLALGIDLARGRGYL